VRKTLLLLATGGALIASVAAAAECPACGGPPRLAVAGIAFYAAVLIGTLASSEAPALRFAYMAATGFHFGLIWTMASRGAPCGLCVATALCSMTATALSLGADRLRWSQLPAVAPWTAALGLLAAPPPPPMEFSPHTRIVAYTRPDCGYCDELRSRVLPEATRGIDVEVVYRDASSAGFVRRAPTLLLSRGTRQRVLEGLPTVARLRDELAHIGGTPP
jgi:hypothetical protein